MEYVTTCTINNQYNTIQDIAALFSLLEREIECVLKDFNLSIAKFNILMLIKHHNEPCGITQTELKKRMVVTASNITKLIDKLYKEGLINRLDQKDDRRVNRITITSKGADLLDKVVPYYKNKVHELTNLIDGEDLKELSERVNKWQYRIKNKDE